MEKIKYSWNLSKLSLEQRRDRQRILEISFKLHLSHLGSCLSAVDLIDAIYKIKSPDEKFILSNGHAGIALYAILEKYGFIRSPEVFKVLNIHPDRNPDLGIEVSSGSLGQGLPIAVGMSLANKSKNVYCMISDGECAEGSIWESLRITKENNLTNLKIVVNANGWGAYDQVSLDDLKKRFAGFGYNIIEFDGHNPKKNLETLNSKNKKLNILFAHTTVEQFPFLKGQDAHYYVMNEKDFISALDDLIWN